MSFCLLNTVSRAILNTVYRFRIPNSDPKLSKVLISGVSFRHHSSSQGHESDVLSYSECKLAKIFQGFAYSAPQTPQAPPKNCWIQLCYYRLFTESHQQKHLTGKLTPEHGTVFVLVSLMLTLSCIKLTFPLLILT